MTKSTHHSFDITLAAQYGVVGAILIHHFQHWINHNKRLGKNQKDGKTWTYQTCAWIAAWFPYLSEDQVRREIKKLVSDGILVKGNYNKSAMDKTLWYAFKNEELFTKGDSAKSTGDSAKWTGDSATPIPDTKTESKTDTEKDNVRTMPSSKDDKKKKPPPKDRFTRKLTADQRKIHDQLLKFIPEWGKSLDSDTICAWFNKKDPFTIKQVADAFLVYKQDVIEAKSRNGTVRCMGACIRGALNNGRKPKNDDAEFNRSHAEMIASQHSFVEVTKRYVKILCGASQETIELNTPKQEFIRQLDGKLNLAKVYV